MNSGHDFYYLQVNILTEAEAEELSALAFDYGATGVEEDLAFEQKNREYEPVTLTKEITSIKIYFDTPPAPEFLEVIKAQFPKATTDLVGEKNRDWLAEWKKSYQPFALCGDIWIVPSWCEKPKEARQEIRIDPEMAFGTGTHETTRLAAGFIYDFVNHSQPAARSLLDVGTGTGILAFLAELKGVENVVANDIDPEARRVARENLEKNKAQHTRITDEDLSAVPSQFDWVVANIIDGVLVRLQDDLKKRVAPSGQLLLTGILQERDELFRSEFSFAGFKIIERRALNEWVGYLLKRSS